MPSKVHTYFFGRLNLLTYSEDKREFLYTALSTDTSEVSGKFKYAFFDVQELTLAGELFVFGRLVKYKPLLEGEVVDEGAHRLVDGGLPHGVVAKSEFFLHYRTSVLAYRPVTNRISANQFCEMFSRLVEAAYQNFFVSAEIDSIDEDIEIERAIEQLDVVSKVMFDLHPSNPSNRAVYRHLDERLKALRAQRLRQTMTACEGGFVRDTLLDDDGFKGLMMAVDGYGKGCVEGIIDGRKVAISTEDSPVKKEVVASESPSNLLHQLIPTFKRIWERVAR